MEQSITLEQMLAAREQRVFTQQKLLKQYGLPMVCFTMNIAGPIKNSPLIRRGFEIGIRYLKDRMGALKITCIHYEETNDPTGNEAYFIMNEAPLTIKKITSDIEDESDLGRLFDMDVLKPDGEKVDRRELGLAPRLCLICGGPARDCARSRTHSVEQLQQKTTQILQEAIDDIDAKDASALACRALLYEVSTTPKPGLVDRSNSGSHKDMDIFTFINSTCALWPYFETCVRIGKATASLPAFETFFRLRQEGKKAEAHMFASTKGANTHKGAIFSMGILCGALGRLPRDLWRISDAVLDECAALTKGIVASDFSALTEETAVTVGEKLYLHYQITGVRGQIEAGLPAVRKTGLPVLKEGISRGLSLNDAGCSTLLSLMVSAIDTNLIARSNIETYNKTIAEVNDLLEKNPFPDHPILEQLDRKFIQMNLSPGGSADLLAICYLLYFLENEA
ncbi:MAG: triphosphoribosyl-dephospho-CoA synthase CitG [Blautia sp.]